MKPVHPTRMQVILDARDYETWLTGTPEEAMALLKPYPSDKMHIVLQGVGLLKDEREDLGE